MGDAHLDRLSEAMGFARTATNEKRALLIVDKVIVLEFRDVEESFEHELLHLEKEAKRLNLGDNGGEFAVGIAFVVLLQKQILPGVF